MWRIHLNQILILLIVSKARSADPSFRVPLEELATISGQQIDGTEDSPNVPGYYYLRETANGEKVAVHFLVESNILKTFSNEESASVQPDEVKIKSHRLDNVGVRSTDAEVNTEELNKNRLGKQFYYQFPIQPQQKLVVYPPPYQGSIPQFYQSSSLFGPQPIIYDYPHQFYNAPKDVLQPLAGIHDPVVSFIHQTSQQIPSRITYKLAKENPSVFMRESATNPAETTESAQSTILKSNTSTNDPEHQESEMKEDKPRLQDEEPSDIRLRSDNSAVTTMTDESMDKLENNDETSTSIPIAKLMEM